MSGMACGRLLGRGLLVSSNVTGSTVWGSASIWLSARCCSGFAPTVISVCGSSVAGVEGVASDSVFVCCAKRGASLDGVCEKLNSHIRRKLAAMAAASPALHRLHACRRGCACCLFAPAGVSDRLFISRSFRSAGIGSNCCSCRLTASCRFLSLRMLFILHLVLMIL